MEIAKFLLEKVKVSSQPTGKDTVPYHGTVLCVPPKTRRLRASFVRVVGRSLILHDTVGREES